MSDLASWRRLDWRFLLPRPIAGRVAVLGSPESVGGDLLELLPGVEAVDLEPRAGTRYEVVVVAPDGRADAIGGLAGPGTVVYRQGSPGGGLRPAAALPGLVRAWWHAPGFARTSYVVARDDATAVDQMLKRHQGVPLGRPKAAAARAVHRLGGIGLLARDLGLVSEAGPRPPDALVMAALGRSAPMRSLLLVTPWFAASRHVIALLTPVGTDRPQLVAKLPRRPGDTGGIDLERAVLARVAAEVPALAGRVPTVVARRTLGGEAVLLETALDGPPLEPGAVRRDVAAATRRGVELVGLLPVTGSTRTEAGWFERLLAGPLQRFASAAPLGAASTELVRRTLQLLAPLREAALPLHLVHGDLSYHNLVLTADGALGALDWERAEWHGLPGQDLVFLLQYLGESRRGVFDRPSQRRVLEEDFLAADGSGRRLVVDHLGRLGIPPRLFEALLVACWARAGASLLDRLAEGSPGPGSGAYESDRDVSLWQYVVQRAGDHMPPGSPRRASSQATGP